PEPAAVVIWRPTPGVVTDPGPAVVVFPNPPARAIRSPIRGHTRSPNVAIGRGDPGAIRVQVFGAVYIGRYILITARAKQILVAIVIPVVELIARNRGFHLKLGVRLGAASEHGPAGGKCLRSPRAVDFRLAGADRHGGRAIRGHRHSIFAASLRPYG